MKVRGLDVVFVVFSLLVLGGAAYYMSTNSAVNYKSGASNVLQSVTGKLVKKGTAAFSLCKSANTTYNYGILTSATACTHLAAVAKIADPLVGQRVIAVGTLQNGIFYATNITLASKCSEQCPGTDGVLRNCHPPESDGTSADSLCNKAGRTEFCGTKNFCCPVVGGKWTTDMSKCPVPTPTVTPTPTIIPKSCNHVCANNFDCPVSYICNAGVCRNPSCVSSTDCVCTFTPKPTPTATPPISTPVSTPVASSTP